MNLARIVVFILVITEYKPCVGASDNQTETPAIGDLFHKTLSEILSGPLKGRKVTVVVGEDQEINSAVDIGISSWEISEPVSLVRLPVVIPEERGKFFDNKTGGYQGLVPFPLESGAVVIIFTPIDLWWLLYFPPVEWSLSAVLIIKLNSCSPSDMLRLPLATTSPSVALICPSSSRKTPVSNGTSLQVWTWKPFASGRQLVYLGPWSSQVFGTWKHLFIDRFSDMTQKEISILCQTKDRPLIYTDSSGVLKGLNFNIMKALSRWLQFGIKYTLEGNVRWTTMTDLVQTGQNDLMINYATLTPQRNRDFDLTVPYYREGFGLMLEVPPPLPRWQNILYPFSWIVWVSVAVSVVTSGVTLHFLNHRFQKSLITNMITVLQSIISRPLEKVPPQWRVRNFLLVWWVVSWLINMSYTCNLIAVLTVPSFPKKIQTAQELVESKYRLCMLDYGEFVPEALATSTHPTLAALGKKLDMMPIVDNLEEIGEETCAERVVAGSHAHTETYSYVKILYSKLGYNSFVYSLQEQLYPGYLAFLVHKNSPWKYKFDQGIQWLMETGLLLKWYQQSMEEFIAPVKEDKSLHLQSLSLAHLQGCFLMLCFGFCVSILAMAWEVVSHRGTDVVKRANNTDSIPLEQPR
ncbi:ionotropic receptor 21a-like [Macrobrachium rosenbergii]|uniref:ionotropic receptor 21a-like n=1 Tax=Macrobrachium rosenbergii TaxID=79674 RepID=UPI0034D4B682